ncbi:MAG: alanine racemase [Lachnospiraceae bacterium]|nr:alanine racemase [Lachnospiraceae bacterium]
MSRRRVTAEVSLEAIENNIRSMAGIISPGTKILAVIKADGYGHGALQVAVRLEQMDCVFGYATATAEEAFKLRNDGIRKPILVLGYTFPDNYEDMIRLDIRPAVFKKETARQLNEAAAAVGRTCRIHIKVDTGMSRIGVPCNEEGIETALEISRYDRLSVEGMFTHFARADEPDKTPAIKQLEKFNDFLRRCADRGLEPELKHCSNSAAILEMPEANMDLVRAGITMYGLWPSGEELTDSIRLEPAMSLKSSIVYIKTLEPGTEISYGGIYTTDKTTRVATVPVGYADGYPRSLSNKGYVLIKGKKAPILGRVCMDQLMVDVTDIPEAQEYDEVVLLGNSGGSTITAEELGSLSGRFNYEFVCAISDRVPRKYV